MEIDYKVNTATENDIFFHLKKCNEHFIPFLDTRVKLALFGKKIFEHTITFEAWQERELVGLVSAYFNDFKYFRSFINHVSVERKLNGLGVSTVLLEMCINFGREKKFKEISLEVFKENNIAINIYKKNGFVSFESNRHFIEMKKILGE